MISTKEQSSNPISFENIESTEKAISVHFYYSKIRDTMSTLTSDILSEEHSKSVDRKAWGVASKSVVPRAIIFDAYIENLIIRINEVEKEIQLKDVKEIIQTSQSYLRTLSKDPVSRMFIGNVVMCFRNNFPELSQSKISTIKRAVIKFQKSDRSFNSFRQYLAILHSIGVSTFKVNH
jgi:hypothetical protein